MAKLALNGGPKLRTEPFAAWPPKDPGFLRALSSVLEDGRWGVGGPQSKRLCETFAAFQDAEYAVACTSGTTALMLCLEALGVGYGDEVIVPAYTFIATAGSVISMGAVPVFADIDPDTFCLDVADAEAKITPRTKAIIPVHIGGMPCDMQTLKIMADKHGLGIVEDCAQAHGAEYQGKRVGAIGDTGAFSFQSSKNVAAGEGGIMVTNDSDLWLRAWSYHNIGRVPEGGWYDHRVFGTNLRLSEFQAAIILRGLELLPDHMQRRDENAMYLRKRLDEIDGIGYQAFPEGATRSAWHLFIFKYDRKQMKDVSRNRFLKALAAEGLPTSSGYNPLYREGMFRAGWDPSKPPFSPNVYSGEVDYNNANCPNCEFVCDDGAFWMPQHILLGTQKDMDDIADAILKVKENLDEIGE
jgi:dTDP-4-amino-4,6-dideoxygalactose transaminase